MISISPDDDNTFNGGIRETSHVATVVRRRNVTGKEEIFLRFLDGKVFVLVTEP